jgi:predicted phosphodiesterase
MLAPEQKEKVAKLMAQENVAVLITQGDQWPTGTMQAFAETDAPELIFIMGETAEKYQNLMKRPHATVLVDTRDVGKIATFEVARASIQGVAHDVPRDSGEFETLKAVFLKKNPFEAPFFGNPALRMVRIAPKRISYANGLSDSFKADF